MKYRRIYAKTGNHFLLEDGKVKLIGFSKNIQHYVNGTCNSTLVIILHYGTKYQDRFYFENNTLAYNSVYMGRNSYIHELYSEITKQKKLSPSQFLDKIVSKYTFKEMGF